MKMKKIIAIVLTSTLFFSSTIFAATTKTSTEGKRIYTYQEVVDKVLRNDSDLSLLEDSIKLLDKQRTSLSYQLGDQVYPTETGSFIELPNYASLEALNNLSVSQSVSRLRKEALTTAAEYSVMSLLASINTYETELQYADEEYAIYREKYNMATLQSRLGMISEVAALNAKTEMEDYAAKVAQAKLELENAYSSLAIAMGISDRNFEIDYSVEYEPYKLIGTLESHISKVTKADPTLQGARLYAENLELTKYIQMINSTETYSYEQVLYNINKANAEVKAAEDGYKLLLEGTYKKIVDLEETIKTLETSLEVAQKSLAATEENYAAGRATKLELDEAKLTVVKLENTIQSTKDGYMNLVYGFNHPAVLSPSAGY